MSPAAQFIKITNVLVDYETGDFLMLSDLADLVAPLKDLFLETNEPYQFIEWILEYIRAEMKQAGAPEFAKTLSEAVDLLQAHLNAADQAQKADIEERMGSFRKQRQKSDQEEEKTPFRDDETFMVFMSDAVDRLAEAQKLVLELEERPEQMETIQALFRVFHTIKGECGFLKIATLGELTHNLENLLDALRSGRRKVESVHIDVLLEGIDTARKIVDQLRKGDVVVFNQFSLDPFYRKLEDCACTNRQTLGDILVEEGKLKEEEVQKILQKQKETAFSKKFGEIAVKENYLTAQELQETLGR